MTNLSIKEMQEIKGGYGLWCDDFEGDCIICALELPIFSIECVKCDSGFADCNY